MRLRPIASPEAIYAWLFEQAIARWNDVSPELDQRLKVLADCMAAISAAEVPETMEPS